jgi:hypothetical protein
MTVARGGDRSLLNFQEISEKEITRKMRRVGCG